MQTLKMNKGSDLMTLKKRYTDIKDAHAALDRLSKNKALYRPHLDEVLKMKKYYYHSLKGLEKQIKKELDKMRNFKIDELAHELTNEVPFELEAVLYSDGSLAYVSQGGMTQNEFNGFAERIASFSLSRDHFSDWIKDFDDITDDEEEVLHGYFTDELIHSLDEKYDKINLEIESRDLLNDFKESEGSYPNGDCSLWLVDGYIHLEALGMNHDNPGASICIEIGWYDAENDTIHIDNSNIYQ